MNQTETFLEDLAILCYSTSEIHIYKVHIDDDIDEKYIKNLGFNPDECSWMFGESINIINH